MLSFSSASVRIVNSERAIAECFDLAFPDGGLDECRAVVINASIGHKLDKLASAIKKYAPQVAVCGSSCSGVIGRDGVGESLHDMALMAISGPAEEIAVSSVRDIYGHNSYEKGLELALSLKAKTPTASAIYLLCPGIDIANDLVLKALVEVFGEETVIFGGTSSDNMKGLVSFQYHDDILSEHDAWAIGFADPTLKSITRATHGFTAYGASLVTTKTDGNKIIELNGQPAWPEYLKYLAMKPGAICGDTIPVGALAEKLPPELAEEYGNSHILRVITKFDADNAIYYPVTCPEGLELWLTNRDEDLIFSEQARSLEYLVNNMGEGRPVAVFQTDCLARGRFLFNKIVKDEIIAMMHDGLSKGGPVPPWLGMYGFGEYTKLGGRNTYHNYSTALFVLYR